jgi:hypothetical protein
MGEYAGAINASSSLVGGGAQAYSSYASGKYNRKIANWNAQVAEVQARDAVSRGEINVANLAEHADALISSNRSSYAAQGVDVSSGSAAQVTADTQRKFQRDAQILRLNAAREAWGFRVQAADYRAKGDMAYREGKNQAIATLLDSTGQASRMYAGQGRRVPPPSKNPASASGSQNGNSPEDYINLKPRGSNPEDYNPDWNK